jgi:hypothetical protein
MSFHNKDVSMAVNLRQHEEAMITVITPSSEIRQSAPIRSAPPATTGVVPATTPQPIRTTAIGSRATSGDECPQAGMWRCDPPDLDSGDVHYIPAWRIFPPVKAARNLNTIQKLRGDQSWGKIKAAWTLVSYDVPHA